MSISCDLRGAIREMRGASCSLSHGRVESPCSEACCAAPPCFEACCAAPPVNDEVCCAAPPCSEACCAAPLTWLLPDGDSDTLRISLMMLTHDARGCCRGHCGCRLCSTAGVCRSKEFWQQAVGTCGLSCQLHRRIDFLAEKSIEVGHEILGRTLFYDVTDLLRQIHGLEGSK